MEAFLHREDQFITVDLYWNKPHEFDILVETLNGTYTFRETDGEKALDIYHHPFANIERMKV